MGHLSDKHGYYKCTACGAIDSIYSNGDAACCLECGTPEHYIIIEDSDNDYRSFREHNHQPQMKGKYGTR